MGKGNAHRRPVPARRIPNTRTRTRLQKPKLADPEQNSQDLARQLQALGLYAANTLGDGNCLFRALCDQLHGHPRDHLILRRDICDWMDAHREHYQGFVEDGRSWNQHISSMRESGTYGGHLELSAFAHLKRRNVKVIQPGLVYVIEWSTGPNAAATTTPASSEPPAASTSTSTSSPPPSPLSSREERRARRDRIRAAKEQQRRQSQPQSQPPTPDAEETDPDSLPAIYVAYHDWEHFSSVRNISGPHQGIPNVVESPAPPPSSATATTTTITRPRSPSPSTTATTTTTTAASSSTPSSDLPLTPPDVLNAASALINKARSPKRSFEDDVGSGSEYGRAEGSKRNRSLTAEEEPEGDSPLTSEEEVEVELDEQSQSRSSVASAGSRKEGRKLKKVPPAKLKPKRVILLVGKKKDREKEKAQQQQSSATPPSSQEWMTNGGGRMDVRGFRELKI